MHPLNLCRQFREWLSAGRERIREEVRSQVEFALEMAIQSNKFFLPVNGVLLEDEQLKGIDEQGELRLPYKRIALEFETPLASDANAEVVFAMDYEKFIRVVVAYRLREGGWAVTPDVYLESSIRRDEKGVIRVRHRRNKECQWSDVEPGINTLLGVLSVLGCSNVRFDKIDARKPPKHCKGTAAPFDSYHVLTLATTKSEGAGSGGGSHRSPREHLRRGHIRRYEDKRIWVNATVVNAGVGGKITKDYRIAA